MLTDSLSLVSFFGRIPPVLRIPEILEMLGRDITLLVGGSVFARSPDLVDNARAFVSSTGRAPLDPLVAKMSEAAPTEDQMAAIRRLRALKYPPIDGNHGKFLEFKADISQSGAAAAAEEDASHWLNLALENYKPPVQW